MKQAEAVLDKFVIGAPENATPLNARPKKQLAKRLTPTKLTATEVDHPIELSLPHLNSTPLMNKPVLLRRKPKVSKTPYHHLLYSSVPRSDAAEGPSGAPSEGLESQFDQEGFLVHASHIIGEDVTDRNTQDVQEMLKVLRDNQTSSVDATRCSSSVSH
jgi:hypothetical protein